MVDARTQAQVQQLLRRESRSFLQYISDSFPWTTPEETDALAQLQKVTDEERSANAALGRFLVRQRITPPHLGPYPVAFTTLNFVSLDHLLPLLAAYERRAIADLENDLVSFADPEGREQVRKLLDMKRQHLKTLEALAVAHPETVLR